MEMRGQVPLKLKFLRFVTHFWGDQMRSLFLALVTVITVLTMGLSASEAFGMGCRGNDREVNRNYGSEQVRCRTRGRCNGYGLNPITGRYEHYYGEHPDCPGYQSRTNTRYTCLDSQGISYYVQEFGSWSNCRVN